MDFLRNLFTNKNQDSTTTKESNKRQKKDFKYISQWGRYGTMEGQFSANPSNVAVDSDNNVYIAEVGNNIDPKTARLTGYISRIQKFDTNGKFLKSWGAYGEGTGHFAHVGGITVDQMGYVYITAKARVLKFDSNGNFVTEWGKKGKGEGEFGGEFGDVPRGLDVDNNGYVYVVDRKNSRVQKFDNNGKFIALFGTEGRSDGQFLEPFDVAVDSRNHYIYVSDFMSGKIQKFDTEGNFLSKWGEEGEFDPHGIAVDVNGDVYVTSGQSVQQFDSNGSLITKWGKLGKGEGEFDRPEGMAVDMQGYVYVADYNNHRIQKFG